MGAARPRRWKLPFHRAISAAGGGGGSTPCSPSSRSSAAPPGPASPARSEAWAAEAVPEEFLCPISGALMADPVILPSGKTFERACLQACAELAFLPPGVEAGGADTLIPNAALKAAIGTWCARSGRAVPAPPSAEASRLAVLRAMPPAAAAAKSVRTTIARRMAVMAASTSNSSYSSPAESTYGSASEITAAEDEVKDKEEVPPPRRGMIKEVEVEAEAEPPVATPVDPLEDDVVGKVMDADDDGVVAAAMGALREATREGAERRRELCTPRLLGALRRVLLLPRHAAARVDAAAALVNLSLSPPTRCASCARGGAGARRGAPLGRVGARGAGARGGALFGLALNEDNRAAIGVLGAVPPLLDLLTSPAHHHPPRARRDAGMALYHLTLAAVNQSKVARFPGAPKALLAVASGAAEPGPIRRLALMVACNVAACAEGRNALMDAGAVASVSAIILSPSHDNVDLEEWCVSAMYAMSRGSLRFRGLARAAGADRALRRVVAGEGGGVRREMARKTLRAMRGDLDDEDGGEYNDLTGSSAECGDGEDCGGSIVSDGLMSFRRRQRELGVSSCGNTAEF
ncbi:unnamed protein product [Miscanthus lutarioriparius]|uniref:RING-type E3 ubiquitin transferase n=1 Tax=Miscanthus lutarioriparius TaxID=422564 RepID=A0A811NBJ1_9POAL|nr:unnamed protein product [Miscanthus lutarioriparius]